MLQSVTVLPWKLLWNGKKLQWYLNPKKSRVKLLQKFTEVSLAVGADPIKFLCKCTHSSVSWTVSGQQMFYYKRAKLKKDIFSKMVYRIGSRGACPTKQVLAVISSVIL